MPQWIIWVIFLVLFAIVMLVVSVGQQFIESQRKKRVAEILTFQDAAEATQTARLIIDEETGGKPQSLFGGLPLYQRIENKIHLGAAETSPETVLLLMVVFAAAGAFLGMRVRTPMVREAAMVGFALIFGSLPYFFISLKASKRMGAFEEMFPEALDFLARSMRAGHAFSVSLEMMAEETPDPVGTEFRWIFHQQNLGAPLEVTLRTFAERIPLVDTKLFVSAVLLQRETGGNLAEILMKLAFIIRERFRLKRQVKAASAHGRLTATILAVMPIVTLAILNVIAPDYFQLMLDDKDGRRIVIATIVLQLTGYYWMKRIINIKV